MIYRGALFCAQIVTQFYCYHYRFLLLIIDTTSQGLNHLVPQSLIIKVTLTLAQAARGNLVFTSLTSHGWIGILVLV